jgi:hypothetical protein
LKELVHSVQVADRQPFQNVLELLPTADIDFAKQPLDLTVMIDDPEAVKSASSVVMTILRPIAAVPPGHLKDGICNPMRILDP